MFIFAFVAFALVSNLKTHYQDACQRAYCLLCSRNFVVWGVHVQVVNAFWVNSCVWCKIVVQYHSFCMCPVFQHHLLKRLSLPLCIFVVPPSKKCFKISSIFFILGMFSFLFFFFKWPYMCIYIFFQIVSTPSWHECHHPLGNRERWGRLHRIQPSASGRARI